VKIQPTIQAAASIPVTPPPQTNPVGAFQPKSATLPPSSASSNGLSRTDQILAELGFAPDLPKPPMPEPVKPAAQLGTLYHRYLHGNDLAGGEFNVTIHDITKEKVIPYPSQPAIEKWCLWVDGLPSGMGNGILFGTRGEEDLMAIFGNVDIYSLRGKKIVIYSKPMNVAGQSKLSIRFRGAK
jgi:hypothetical protein